MKPKQTTGLVLEGGAMRGLFSSAVLDVLMRENIQLDGMIGVSAGATFGCNYVTRQPGRAFRYCMNYRHDPRFCSVPSLLLTGDMYGAEFCYHTLPEKLDPIDNEAFVSNPTPFYIVATDVNTGKAVYHLCRDIISHDELEWVRACASMPLASQIVSVGGRELLDGGIADSIPLRYFEYKGYRRNVVILTQPAGYQKHPNSMMPFIRRVYRKYPALIRAMERRHIVYNRQVAYVEEAAARGDVFLIRPASALPVKHVTHRADKLQAVYDAGKAQAEKQLPALLEFLQK